MASWIDLQKVSSLIFLFYPLVSSLQYNTPMGLGGGGEGRVMHPTKQDPPNRAS
jgi:hypothetical protein